MNTPEWLKVGNDVSIVSWDRTELHHSKIGSPAKIIKIKTGENCETGIMVTVRGTTKKIVELDMNWLKPFDCL